MSLFVAAWHFPQRGNEKPHACLSHACENQSGTDPNHSTFNQLSARCPGNGMQLTIRSRRAMMSTTCRLILISWDFWAVRSRPGAWWWGWSWSLRSGAAASDECRLECLEYLQREEWSGKINYWSTWLGGDARLGLGWRLLIIICSLGEMQPASCAICIVKHRYYKCNASTAWGNGEKSFHLRSFRAERAWEAPLLGLRDVLINLRTGFVSLVGLTVDFMSSSRLRLDKLRALAMFRCKSRIDLCNLAASADGKLD